MKKKKNKLKAVLLAVLSLTLLFGSVSTANAATYTATSFGNHSSTSTMLQNGYFCKYIKIVNQYYNEDLCNYPFGAHGGGAADGNYDPISLFFVSFNGQSGVPAYCIEPGAPASGDFVYSGATGATTSDPYWKYLKDTYPKLTNSISLAIGYSNQYKGQSDFYGARAACQIIVWELMGGYRDISTRKVTNTALRNACAGTRFVKYYDLISNQLINHSTYPSYVSDMQITAPTVTLTFDETNQEWGKTVTTSKGNVDMMDYTPLEDIGIIAEKINDTTVYFSTANYLPQSVSPNTLYKDLPQSLYTGDMYVWTTYSSGERGQCIVTGADNDPVPLYMKFATASYQQKVTVNYFDKYTGEKIAESYITSDEHNEPYDVTDKKLANISFENVDYSLDSVNGDSFSGTLDSDKEINLYYGYNHNITVNYFDKYTGEKIAESFVTADEHNQPYDVIDKKLANITFGDVEYSYDSQSGDRLSGTLDTDKVINLYYSYGHSLTVNYYDKYTNEKIAESFITADEHNQPYDVIDKKLANITFGDVEYSYDSQSGDRLSGTLDTDKVINLYYGYGHSVTVNYYDKYTGEQIMESYITSDEHNAPYDVTAYYFEQITADEIEYLHDTADGDSFSGTLDCNKEINLYYGYLNKIIIQYKEIGTENVLAEEVSYISEHLKDYDVTNDTVLDIVDYTREYLTGDEAVGTFDCDKEITVWYKAIPAPIPETDDNTLPVIFAGVVCLACMAVVLKRKKDGAKE